MNEKLMSLLLIAVICMAGITLAIEQDQPTPIVLSGYVTYVNGDPVSNLNVTITKTSLNTSENFTVKTVNNSNYYRMQADSTHVRAGDMIRINATDGTNYNETVHTTITEADIKNGGLFMQNLTLVSKDPDLVISDWSRKWNSFENKAYNITYTVRNIGDVNASESTTAIYIDDIEVLKDSAPALASCANYSSTLGPFNSTPHNKSLVIEVCADGDNTVDERNEENNCLKKEFQINLEIKIETLAKRYWVDELNGRFEITYNVTNPGDAYADASNTTINITNVTINGSVSDVIIKERVPALAPNDWYENTSGLFTCLCNHTVNITACADADNELLESDEDNCKKIALTCPASACKPDLKIVTESILGTWINRSNRTFNIVYEVKNIGNGNASNSTTRILNTGPHWTEEMTEEILDTTVPELASGESYISTVGPFMLPSKCCWAEIGICANCNGYVSESNDDNNCNNCTDEPYVFGVPYLSTTPIGVDYKNKTYNISYTVKNYGGGKSNVTEACLYIDGIRTNVTDTVPELAKRSLEEGVGGSHSNTLGPFNMTGTSDTFQVRMDEYDGEYVRGMLSSAACVADDGTRFRCGDRITKSCKFTGDMYCGVMQVYTGRKYPHGLFIDSDNITIDGNGSAIIGDRDACACMFGGAEGDIYIAWTGITSCAPGSIYPGYDNVTIKNLEVRNFCNGISIVNADNNRIENCSVHDNGATVQYNYGIYVENSSHITIDRCEVYNNTGILTGMNVAGGHGINFQDDCDYCAVTNSNISHNYLSGILASPTCKYLYIANNLIENNGYCNESGFCTGINLHSKGGLGMTTNSTVENNVILNNTGSGIYVTQGYTSIKNNTIKGSKKNDTDLNVNGDGILVDGGNVTFLYNNTCCENKGTDIFNRGSATFGDDNTCNTTSNYNDEGTRGCNFFCRGVNCVCVGSTKNFRCGDIVTESCAFNRSMSCRGYDGNGLIIGADNITIDGAGYALTGNYSGIGVISNHSGVTIKNLQVEDFSTGMEIENASGNFIENCTVRTNLLTGINFSAGNGTVRNSRIYDNVGPGILVGGGNNTFENNTVAKNKNGTLHGYGIYFSPDAKGNNISANFLGDNEGMDIYNDDGKNIGDNNTCDTTFCYNDTGMADYNCTYPWTPPDLMISNKFEKWVDEESARYNVTYTIENNGAQNSRPAGNSMTYLYIDTKPSEVADDRVGSLKPGERQDRAFDDYTAKMSNQSDKIKVCADGPDEVKENNTANIFYYDKWYGIEESYSMGELFEDHEANNCLENEFSKEGSGEITIDPDAACVGWRTGTEYRCSHSVLNTVTESCMFNGNMSCPAGHDLIIGKSDIVIDGAGYALIGTGSASCAYVTEADPAGEDGDCGILNMGCDGVTIKDLTIVKFCNGIGLKNVKNNRIESCNIYNNGNPTDGGSHGIHMANVESSTIKNCRIHDNTGTGSGCSDGGNGIFMYKSCSNTVTGNEIYENRKGGIFMKMKSMHNDIIDNDVHENSQGGIILRCVNSNDNTIEGNDVSGNYGDGIFAGGKDNVISKNIVNDNKAGHRVGDTIVEDGDGIDMGRNDGSRSNELNNNEVCYNTGTDIKTPGEDYENTGDNNCCNNTERYDDEGTTGCTWSCPCGEKPDLKIENLDLAWVNKDVKTYKITYTIANIGNGNAPESITHIWINDEFNRGDNAPALGVNESDKSETKTVSNFTLSGKYDEITVCANGEGKKGDIEERNYDNNCLSKKFPPVLTEIVVSPPTANLSVGETQLFTATAYDQNEPHHTIGEIVISWNSSDEMVGTVNPPSSETDTEGNATTVFTADSIGGTTITAESGGISGDAEVTVWFEDLPPPPPPGIPHGGPGGPSGKEKVTGYGPGPGGGTGEFGTDIGGEQLPVNESGAASGGKTWETGHLFGLGGEIPETVKVVAPVFLIVLPIIVIVLFYSGYFGEKRAHRRNKKRT